MRRRSSKPQDVQAGPFPMAGLGFAPQRLPRMSVLSINSLSGKPRGVPTGRGKGVRSVINKREMRHARHAIVSIAFLLADLLAQVDGEKGIRKKNPRDIECLLRELTCLPGTCLHMCLSMHKKSMVLFNVVAARYG